MTTAANILNSQLHPMHSQHSGRDYRITISLPLGYTGTPEDVWPFDKTPAKWPVVYVVDGNWYGGMVTDIVRSMAWCGSTSDAIVVGIGYPEVPDTKASVRVSFTRRNADLTPVRDEAEEKGMEAHHTHPAPSGDAAGFLKFLQQELVPFIEANYNADPAQRIFVGHSYGGLFGLFAMFEAPELFSTLVLGSPTLIYGNRFTFAREEAFAKEHTKLPARVYFFVGDLEEDRTETTVTDTLRIAAILQGRNYEGYSSVKRIFHDLNHCEVVAPGYQAGLKFALKK